MSPSIPTSPFWPFSPCITSTTNKGHHHGNMHPSIPVLSPSFYTIPIFPLLNRNIMLVDPYPKCVNTGMYAYTHLYSFETNDAFVTFVTFITLVTLQGKYSESHIVHCAYIFTYTVYMCTYTCVHTHAYIRAYCSFYPHSVYACYLVSRETISTGNSLISQVSLISSIAYWALREREREGMTLVASEY